MVWMRQSIQLRPSPRLAAYVVSIHGIAAAGILATPLAHYAVLGILVLLAASLTCGLCRVLLLSPRAVSALTYDRDGTWSLELVDGAELTVELRPGALIHPRFMVLSFRGPRRGLSLALIDDNADRDQVRRLRVRLRLGG